MSKDIEVRHVPTEWVHAVWPKVEKYVEQAVSQGLGEYSVDNVKNELASGQQTMLIGVKGENIVGCITIKVSNTPQQRIAYVTSYGGRLVTTPELFKDVETWCLSMGATKIQAYAKEAQMRLYRKKLGFTTPCYVVEKNYA